MTRCTSPIDIGLKKIETLDAAPCSARWKAPVWQRCSGSMEVAREPRSQAAAQGLLTDEQPLFTGGSVTIDRQALSGPHQDQIPLADQVVSFP